MTAEPNAATLLQDDEPLESADSTLKAALGATITLIALTVVWELLVRQFQVPAWLLPSPSLIGQSMVEWRSELVGHSMVTLYETLVGFACGHVFHLTHLLERLHPGEPANKDDFGVRDELETSRGVIGAKVTHARLLRDRVWGGCPVCVEREKAM